MVLNWTSSYLLSFTYGLVASSASYLDSCFVFLSLLKTDAMTEKRSCDRNPMISQSVIIEIPTHRPSCPPVVKNTFGKDHKLLICSWFYMKLHTVCLVACFAN